MKLRVPDAGGDGVDVRSPMREQLRSADAVVHQSNPDTYGVSPMLDLFRRAGRLQVNEAIIGSASRTQAGNAQNG